MLEAVPTGFFSTNFRLEENGALVGEIDTSMWQEKAQLELQEGTYSLYRTGVASGDFVAERNGTIVARATKPSFIRPNFDVELAQHRVKLRRPKFWRRGYGVFESDNQIGSIFPTTFFSRRTTIELPVGWSILDRSFLFWLCLIMWKRQRRSE